MTYTSATQSYEGRVIYNELLRHSDKTFDYVRREVAAVSDRKLEIWADIFKENRELLVFIYQEQEIRNLLRREVPLYYI